MASDIRMRIVMDAAGRCCGRKPIVYKREPHLFCPRCDAAYDPDTERQIANWAWLPAGDGWFTPRYPDRADLSRATVFYPQAGGDDGAR